MSTEITTIALDLLIAGIATRLSVAEAFRYAEEFVAERDRRSSTAAAPAEVAERPDPTPSAVPPRDMAEAAEARTSVVRMREPQWGRTPGGTWHLWANGASEAECGEPDDGPVTVEMPGEARDPEATCDDCRMSETGDVVDASDDEPIEYDPPGRIHPASGPLIAAGLPIPASHSGAVRAAEADKPARPPRKPTDRRCCAPGCDTHGELAKNASGAKVARSAFLCAQHMTNADLQPASVRTWAHTRREERAKADAAFWAPSAPKEANDAE